MPCAKNSCKVLGSGIIKDYAAGTQFNIDYLVEVMITQSDNTATNMFIDYLGMDSLNNYFKRLGLSDTNLVRKMMDFKSRKAGLENFTSARDVAFLLEKIYNNKLINKDFSGKCLEILKRQKARDRIPKKLPSDAVVAHKTGLEKGVCHDAGIVFTPNGDFLICVLTRHTYKYAAPAKNSFRRSQQMSIIITCRIIRNLFLCEFRNPVNADRVYLGGSTVIRGTY